jgi:hypothetical protein
MKLNLLTSLLMLIFWGATAASSEQHEVKGYHFGQEANITVDDNTGDCVFELEQQPGRTCCFAREVLLDELCPKSKQTGTGCREWGAKNESSRYTLKHRRKENDFILTLPNFQESDVGIYNITCSGRFEKTVELSGREQKNSTEFDEGTIGIISASNISQATNHQRCIFRAETGCTTCCYESDNEESLCKETVNGGECSVRVEDCLGNGICRSYQVTEENGSCTLRLQNIDSRDAGSYKVTFVNHGEAVVDVSVRPPYGPLVIFPIIFCCLAFVLLLALPLCCVGCDGRGDGRGNQGAYEVCCVHGKVLKYRRLTGAIGVCLTSLTNFICIYQYWFSCSKGWGCEGFGSNCAIFLLSSVSTIFLRPVIVFVAKKYLKIGAQFGYLVIILFVTMGPFFLIFASISRDTGLNHLRLLLLVEALPQVLLQIAFCAANGLPLPTNVYNQIFLGYMPFMGLVTGIFVSALEFSTYMLSG